MSMTQEEIEALMNDTSLSTQEDESQNSIDDILDGIDGIVEDGPSESASDEESTVNSDESIDDILANIDGIVEDGSSDVVAEDISEPESEPESSNESNDIAEQIDHGVYPLPVSNEHQVVNQLNEVAEDSEEKASQIFDVLSYILDENDKIQREVTNMQTFLDDQIQLLETLGKKFPNISVFLENLEKAQSIKTSSLDMTNIIDNENAKVFEAMELMQYHDINRQKIERVMAVIRKLANYLNGIFSDDSAKPEVQIAKHISGDGMETVSEDDLDSLISEFNNS